MNELQQELFEKQLLSISKGLDYPRTPDIAESVMVRLSSSSKSEGRPRFISRRLAWSLTVILILFSSLMLIPPARAAIIEFIQIGIVRIFRAEPTPLTPPHQEFPSTMVPVTATPGATSQPLIPILENLAGEMTLEEAQQTVNYPILLPSHPPDLGQPDRVFVQEADGDMTILVWMDPQQPDDVLMSLHLVPEGSWAIEKVSPTIIQETTVNGQRAIWAVGPYPIRFSNGNLDFVRLVDGRVLIWVEGDMTYRLETDLSLEEAINVAESLAPIR
ncbi:MAG TPA: hypothetical protein VMN99_12085 [Anaerolineales bacterium]|nr:hypothetical protein [Anaerolineales bacterium]